MDLNTASQACRNTNIDCSKTAIRSPCLSHVAPISKQRAVQAEFVHLDEFLTSNPRPTTDEDLARIYMNPRGELTLRSPVTPGITRLEKWLEAWNLYERTLMFHDPNLYHGLAMYRDFILKSNKKFYWSAVYTYDQRTARSTPLTRVWYH